MTIVILALAFVLLAVIAALLHRIVSLDRERKALLDRLLVANQIMPLMKDPPQPKQEAPEPQRIKFKLFP